MKVELISIGDELLIGQTINTNASWLGQELSLLGCKIIKGVTISDTKDAITGALDEIQNTTQLCIITGGLGPTNDDITKYTLASYFDMELEMNEEIKLKIQQYFQKRNRPMLSVNEDQALMPKGALVLNNNYGTAAGILIEKNNQIFVSLPGVPYEMKGIVLEELIPYLKNRFELKGKGYKTALTQGIGESFLAEKIKTWEEDLTKNNFSLAYLPSPGFVKLRITAQNDQEGLDEINTYFKRLEQLIPEAIFGYNEDTLPKVIGAKLKEKNLSIGTVESCTGGMLAAQISSVSGASEYFMGSLLTYSNEMKSKLAAVDPGLIEAYGAVSEKVACAMAEGGREKLNVSICIATTGIAGPTGGTDTKPVGLVWIAIATPSRTISKSFQYGDQRDRNIQMAVASALNLLRYEVLS
jgi:nicotinamide-nucleotide amidase